MKRNELINSIIKLAGVSQDQATNKYENIKEFLYVNGARIKDIESVELKDALDENENFTMLINLGEYFGNVEC